MLVTCHKTSRKNFLQDKPSLFQRNFFPQKTKTVHFPLLKRITLLEILRDRFMKIYSTLILSLFLCPKPLLLANSPANCSPLTSSYSSRIDKKLKKLDSEVKELSSKKHLVYLNGLIKEELYFEFLL